MMGFGMFFMFVFWILLIALVIWLLVSFIPGNHRFRGDHGDVKLSAHEILDFRYARGEITREQYELMKQDLK